MCFSQKLRHVMYVCNRNAVIFVGRTSAKTVTKKARHELRKEERRNKAAQIRQKKRDEVLFKKRSLGGSTSAPFLIAIVSLCGEIDPLGVLEFLKQADEEAVITRSHEGTLHIR
jgi:pre-rRNA-processing protein TSR1